MVVTVHAYERLVAFTVGVLCAVGGVCRKCFVFLDCYCGGIV